MLKLHRLNDVQTNSKLQSTVQLEGQERVPVVPSARDGA
jgi:hypothetical protein